MWRGVLFVLLMMALVHATQGADGEAVRLKVYQGKVGDRWKCEKTSNDTSTMSINLMGKKKKETKKESTTVVYNFELLAKPKGAKKPTKFSRDYSRAERTTNGEKKDLPYKGLTVLFENRDGKYRFTTDGEELADDEAEDFKKEFDPKKGNLPSDQDFLPDHPIKPGESWVSDSEKVLKDCDNIGPFILDKKKTILRGKLLRIYRKDGALYGVIRLDQEIVIKSADFDGQELPAEEGSKITMSYDIDFCIDGSNANEVVVAKVDLKLGFEIPNGSIILTGTTAGQETTTMLPRKP